METVSRFQLVISTLVRSLVRSRNLALQVSCPHAPIQRAKPVTSRMAKVKVMVRFSQLRQSAFRISMLQLPELGVELAHAQTSSLSLWTFPRRKMLTSAFRKSKRC